VEKETIIKIFKILNIASYPMSLTILYFLYPEFIKTSEKAMLYWFAIVGIGVVFFNNRHLSIVEKSKETASLGDFFSYLEMTKIKKNPDDYFTPDMYKKYINNLQYIRIYIGLAVVSLFFIG